MGRYRPLSKFSLICFVKVMDSGFARVAFNHRKFIYEISGAISKSLTVKRDYNESRYTLWSTDDKDFAKNVSEKNICITVKVMSRTDKKSMLLNQRIREDQESMLHGDMILKVRIVDDIFNVDTMVKPEAKKKKVMSLDDEKEDGSIDDSADFEMKTNSAQLRAASPHFARMLNAGMKESTTKTMTICAENVEDVHGMIGYLFTAKWSKGSALRMLKLAHFYELQVLFEECKKKIVDDLKVENFVETAKLMSRFQIEHGHNELLIIGKEHFYYLEKQKAFETLPFWLRMALNAKRLHVADEEDNDSDSGSSIPSSYE